MHINANREGMGGRSDHWMDFNVGWKDNEWHHVAVSWVQSSGEVALYFDGTPQVPFWVSQAGVVEVAAPEQGGVNRHIAAGTLRAPTGSLVLAQKQESWGGNFSPQYGMHGDLANLRIWGRVLNQQEIAASMFSDPANKDGLAFSYSFDPANVEVDRHHGIGTVWNRLNPHNSDLYLGADAPAWVYSTAPLADNAGAPVAPPTPGEAGYALFLSDQQVGRCSLKRTAPPVSWHAGTHPCSAATCLLVWMHLKVPHTLVRLSPCSGAHSQELPGLSLGRDHGGVLDAEHRRLPQGGPILLRHRGHLRQK